MFGVSWAAVGAGGDGLLERERNPPPKPIPLEFPNYVPPRCNSPLTRQHIKNVCGELASIRKLPDIRDDHLAHLNIHLLQHVPLPELVPNKQFHSRPLLYDNDLTAMLEELEVGNEDAYREVLRLAPLEGRKKPRLAYSRNFFASLEDMSRYWDYSKDNYYEVESSATEDQAKDTEQKTEYIEKSVSNATDIEMQDPVENSQSSGQEIGQTANHNHSPDSQAPMFPLEMPSRPKMKQVYKGQRLGNGEQMSPGTRVSAVRNLLKMAVHKFNCRDYDVSPREKLRIHNINIPSVSYNFCVAKLPTDTKLLRARMVEGPVMAVHCRHEVRFKSRDGLLSATSDFVGEKFDLFREIGGMLMLAKQRAREGQTLSKEPGEHQWWAIKSRWGGGETRWGQLASEVFEDEDPSWSPGERRLQLGKREEEEEERRKAEAAAAADLKNLKPEDLMSGPASPSERPKKKKKSGEAGASPKDKAEYKDGRRLMYVPPLRRKWYQEWLKVRPNGPYWDEKVIHRRIGKQSQDEGPPGWDDIFMISAANHHACILKLSVHEKYLDWLETGGQVDARAESQETASKADVHQRQEHVLYVSRSPWLDLFDVEQRKELLVGIWRILSWINRHEVPRGEIEKMETLKSSQQQQGEAQGEDHQMEL
ncbi:uncharacterized protein Z520_12307 [Fonsecaea multimorphosa CBS 102226]|uniref:Uncharacterized protein n=1 Tax=Fonsecaea multimorphosa CBS 102226 TaxID=1442371 RepID=A0A0D2GR41_9EURO|nr:uncharacterized protein Z520_12307 [Fonsecaea multimorphosa CBS 102226]KIX91980.1 hypothetical protein Z520_12307 [Fonsecaea multimorphosa CBS 102226]OAL19881.1 hypothetical protein AYO22_09408 [Fonsecaea multimorphosa]